MDTLEQWREQKRRQAKATRFRKNAGLGFTLMGLVLTFMAVPLTGPIEAGLICMGLIVTIFGIATAIAK